MQQRHFSDHTEQRRPAPRPDDQPTRAALWTAFGDLRQAAARYGLKDRSLTVLQALISFVRSGNGLVVFPSNRALSERSNGIVERTLRRHLGRLVAAGLLRRQDSPNLKRYAHRSRGAEIVEAYGFDLRPLLERAQEIAAEAEEAREEQARIERLRDRLSCLRRALIERAGGATPCPAADEIARLLRRKSGSAELRDALAALEAAHPTPAADALPTQLTGDAGQSGRHCQMSDPEDLNPVVSDRHDPESPKDRPPVLPPTAAENWEDADGASRDESRTTLVTRLHRRHELTPETVLAACPEAAAFLDGPVRSWDDLARHAASVAAWMGIGPNLIGRAVRHLGLSGMAMTVLGILQMGGRVQSPGAYLSSLVDRERGRGFDPAELIRGLLSPRVCCPASGGPAGDRFTPVNGGGFETGSSWTAPYVYPGKRRGTVKAQTLRMQEMTHVNIDGGIR